MYFGWWIVLACSVIGFWGQGISHFGFTSLLKPIASELGFSRAATSVAASIVRLEGGLVFPVVGWVIDKFGPRWMVFAGALIIGLSLMLMNFVHSLWAFYLVWGILLGTGANIGLVLPLEKTITNWFVKKRGLALSIRHMFIGLAATVIIPLIAWLISMQGWRVTCVIAGGVMWIIGLPLAWFFVKQHRPEYYGLLPDGVTTEDAAEISQVIDRGVKYATEAEEIEFTLRQAMRTRAYWLLVVAYASFSIIPPVLVIHSMPFVTDMGIDPVKAGVMIGLMSICGTPGTFIGGFVADRCKKQHLRFLHAGAYFLQIIGFTAFLLRRTLAMVYPLFILHNLSMAIVAPLTGVITARYFGRKAFGSIRGTIMMFMLPVAVLAPIYAGWVYDTTGSYTNVFIVCLSLLTFSTIVISLASPPRLSGQVTDIHKIT